MCGIVDMLCVLDRVWLWRLCVGICDVLKKCALRLRVLLRMCVYGFCV